MALIGVIIPVYNVEKYLERCINSVINQSFKDIEIILVNDGSTDNSGNICDEYAKKDKRIKVIHKKNGGLSDARNYGIRASKAKYILFLDSDDYWVENSLCNISHRTKSDVDVVFLSSAKLFDKTGKIEERFDSLDRKYVYENTKEEVFKYLAKVDKFPVSACTKLIKKDLIVDNKIFFEKGLLSEDIDWSTKLLLKAETFDVCNDDFYIYRQQRDGSITNSIKFKNVEDLMYIIKKWYTKCKNKEVDEKLIDSVLALYSYEYAILMGHLYNIKKTERKKIINDVKNMRDILNYSNSNKTKLVKNISKIIGFSNTSKVLNMYIRSKV